MYKYKHNYFFIIILYLQLTAGEDWSSWTPQALRKRKSPELITPSINIDEIEDENGETLVANESQTEAKAFGLAAGWFTFRIIDFYTFSSLVSCFPIANR